MARRINYLSTFSQPWLMRQDRLLAVFLLLLLLLIVQLTPAGLPVLVYDRQDVDPSRNGYYVSLSASKSDGGDLDGGYGAVIEAKVAPATGVS